MSRIFRNAVLLLMVIIAPISAQTRQGIVRIAPFTGTGIPSSELATLERLIASHVAELRLFRVIDDTGSEMALGETEIAMSLGYQSNPVMPLTADFILSGHLGKIGDLYIFTLENTRVSSGEKISVSDTSSSINDAVLRARSLTRSLFGKADDTSTGQTGNLVLSSTKSGYQPNVEPDIQPSVQQGTTPEEVSTKPDTPNVLIEPAETSASSAQPLAPPPAGGFNITPTLAQVAGTWRGDRGLETVRLFPNGTGMALLSGGGTMKLRITLDDDVVVISQDQANDVAMYRSATITFDIARKIASLARPMKWIFRLSADSQNLAGTKESMLVSGTSTSITVDNDYVREASWTRISR